MQESTTQVYALIAVATSIFLLVPIFLLVYVRQYNLRKLKHAEEKRHMAQQFEGELLKTQIEVQEQTMQTIASNLHDNIGQLLSLTKVTLASINISNTEKTKEKIDTSADLINQSIKELRALAKLLQGEKLLKEGIAHAIAQEVNWLKRAEIYKIDFENGLMGLSFPGTEQKDLIVLRLFQEIINNIVKHAQASEIMIQLHYLNNELSLKIAENGIGFNYAASKEHHEGLGLYSMEKRVKLLHGTFILQSAPNQGTKINISIPYP